MASGLMQGILGVTKIGSGSIFLTRILLSTVLLSSCLSGRNHARSFLNHLFLLHQARFTPQHLSASILSFPLPAWERYWGQRLCSTIREGFSDAFNTLENFLSVALIWWEYYAASLLRIAAISPFFGRIRKVFSDSEPFFSAYTARTSEASGALDVTSSVLFIEGFE